MRYTWRYFHSWRPRPIRLRAYSYLVLYNVLFVAPLLVILFIASSRKGLTLLARWQQRYRERVRFVIGTSVIAIGLALLAMI